MPDINANEATATDLRVIEDLKKIGWKVGDTLLYRPRYPLSSEQQKEFPGRKSIEPDIVLQDLQGTPLAVFENKLDDPKKGLPKLRLLYSHILRPRYLYACSAERNLFYDMAWTGLEAGGLLHRGQPGPGAPNPTGHGSRGCPQGGEHSH